MKKSLLYLWMLLLCSASLFTGCSDDDNGGSNDDGGGTGTVVLQDYVAGTYDGQLTVDMSGVDLTPEPLSQRIFIKRDGSDKVALSLRDFSISIGGSSLSVGDIIVEGVSLSGDANNVVLNETTVTLQHADLGELPTTVSGNVAAENATLTIDVVWKDGGNQTISVAYTGRRTSTEADDADYAQALAGFYGRSNLTCDYESEDFELAEPKSGITLDAAGYNKMSASFRLSFPVKPEFGNVSDTYKYQSLKIESVSIQKNADGSFALGESKGTISSMANRREAIEYTVSGTISSDKVLTLNVNMKSETFDVNYVYTSSNMQREGETLTAVSFDDEIVVSQPAIIKSTMSGTWVAFYVDGAATSEQLNLVPTFTISDGAKVILNGQLYENGTPVDFSKTQRITVVSERNYMESGVEASGTEYVLSCGVLNFGTNLDQWEQKNATTDADLKYDEPIGGWSTSNPGVEYLKSMSLFTKYDKTKPYAVTMSTDAVSGNAARLETLYSGGSALPMVPVVTSGSLFNGLFLINNITNTLTSTQFGQPCAQEPKSFSGAYKYKAGETYYVCPDPSKANVANVDETKKDAPAINAILYEVEDYTEYLDGTNLLISDKIAAIASVKDAGDQESYVSFNVNFEWQNGKSWDASKKYKLAIVCSSSKDGDKFSGAPGSVLYVDDLKVNF